MTRALENSLKTSAGVEDDAEDSACERRDHRRDRFLEAGEERAIRRNDYCARVGGDDVVRAYYHLERAGWIVERPPPNIPAFLGRARSTLLGERDAKRAALNNAAAHTLKRLAILFLDALRP